MNKARLRTRGKSICPSCKTAIHFRPEKDDIGVCPRCGEWLIGHGSSNRRLEQLSSEEDTDFDDFSGQKIGFAAT